LVERLAAGGIRAYQIATNAMTAEAERRPGPVFGNDAWRVESGDSGNASGYPELGGRLSERPGESAEKPSVKLRAFFIGLILLSIPISFGISETSGTAQTMWLAIGLTLVFGLATYAFVASVLARRRGNSSSGD
jgi:hypothetical protein